MLKAILSSFFAALFGFARDFLGDLRRDQSLKEQGAADAALATDKKIEDRADEQRKNDNLARGGASDVARRLRDRIAASRGGERQ